MEAVLQLNAVGTNVLHRCRADSAWHQCQIFEARVTMLDGPRDQVMPKHTGSRFDDPMGVRFLCHCNTGDFYLQYHSAHHITRQYDVAPATQYQYLAALVMGTGSERLQISDAANAHQGVRAGDNAEGVAVLQGGIFLD